MENKRGKCLGWSVVRETQIIIPVGFHLTLIRIPVIKETNDKYLQGVEQKWTPVQFWEERQLFIHYGSELGNPSKKNRTW